MPENDDKTLWHKAWQHIEAAPIAPKRAFGTPVVATVSAEGVPRSRTLVLRKANLATGELWCFTDRRSVKAQQIAAGNSIMSWTFWDPEEQLQFNCHGTTRWLASTDALAIFEQLPKHSRKAYATLAPPGSPQDTATDGLPVNWSAQSLMDTKAMKAHFGVLITRVEYGEVLQLNRSGHRRLQGVRQADNTWALTWLVP